MEWTHAVKLPAGFPATDMQLIQQAHGVTVCSSVGRDIVRTALSVACAEAGAVRSSSRRAALGGAHGGC